MNRAWAAVCLLKRGLYALVVCLNAVSCTQLMSASPQGPTLVDTEGLGLIVGKSHLGLGWMHETVVSIPDPSRCTLVIYVRNPEIVSQVLNTLRSAGTPLDKVCMTGEVGDEH